MLYLRFIESVMKTKASHDAYHVTVYVIRLSTLVILDLYATLPLERRSSVIKRRYLNPKIQQNLAIKKLVRPERHSIKISAPY